MYLCYDQHMAFKGTQCKLKKQERTENKKIIYIREKYKKTRSGMTVPKNVCHKSSEPHVRNTENNNDNKERLVRLRLVSSTL